MKIIKIVIDQSIDETGALEEFTWDLFTIVDSAKTLHLHDQGIPKLGTRIREGMIVFGKFGKTVYFDENNQPTSLELHTLSFEKLRAKYGKMWKDTSIYATKDMEGTIVNAYVENVENRLRGVV